MLFTHCPLLCSFWKIILGDTVDAGNPAPPGMFKKPLYQPQLVNAGFLKHQQHVQNDPIPGGSRFGCCWYHWLCGWDGATWQPTEKVRDFEPSFIDHHLRRQVESWLSWDLTPSVSGAVWCRCTPYFWNMPETKRWQIDLTSATLWLIIPSVATIEDLQDGEACYS